MAKLILPPEFKVGKQAEMAPKQMVNSSLYRSLSDNLRGQANECDYLLIEKECVSDQQLSLPKI